MTATAERATAANWAEPDGVAPRGTLIVIPGRGEAPELYERFGRRIAADAYRVHVVADPAADPALTTSQVLAITAEVRPYVLVGSDTGALFAAGLVASGQVTGVDAVVLAGLPTAAERGGCRRREAAAADAPSNRGRRNSRRGPPAPPIAAGWRARGCAGGRCSSPSRSAGNRSRTWGGWPRRCSACTARPTRSARSTPPANATAQAPQAELIGIAGGVHDVLNDVTHRTVAATIVLFLERLRLGAELPPIAVSEKL